MKKIGMLVAVEIDSVRRRYGEAVETETVFGFTVYTYKSENYALYVLNSGVGEIAAAAGTQLLISCYGVDLILNFGVVGGLTEEMGATKACVVEKIVHYDFDTSAYQQEAEKARYLEYPDIYIPTTPALLEKALTIAPELKRVVCASADKFIADPAQKAALHDEFGADICEMESAGIVLTANRAGVPCLLIKTVSDGIHGGAEEFHTELERTSDLCLEIADRVIRGL